MYTDRVRNRQRITIAHEIGDVGFHHYELSRNAFADKKIRIVHRDTKSSSRKYQCEVEANQCAVA